MEKKTVLKILSYVLVAALASVITLVISLPLENYLPTYYPTGNGAASQEVEQGSAKLRQILNLVDQCFIGDADTGEMTDAAAAAIIEATGDRWSHYIPASSMESYTEQMENAYVGIGITIQVDSDERGFLITQVNPSGAAKAAGILPGDVLVEAEGKSLAGMDSEFAASIIRGEPGTQVTVGVIRGEEKLTFTVERMMIYSQVATGAMIDGDVGYVRIANFNSGSAEQTIKVIEDLQSKGAKALIFDVRFNPGGYKHELVKLLDYLLPQGDLFISQDYTGKQTVDTSDEYCLQMPMAVLVNGHSYSAAEFFAAALSEYNWATVVGQPTVGKGNFQVTLELSDGSAIALSTGKYFTPNGVSLADEGGLVPNRVVEVDAETEVLIYGQLLPLEEDLQVQAALEVLKGE